MTITEFLLARIAEDKAGAQAATAGPWRWRDDPEDGLESETAMQMVHYPASVVWANGMHTEGYVNAEDSDRAHIARWNPARVLAECEAKRRIVEEHEVDEDHDACWVCAIKDGSKYGDGWGDKAWPCPTMRILASGYADHPDFREEWRA